MATPITEIRGIGASTAAVLAKHGFKSAEDLAKASIDEIVAVPGFGESRAQKIKEAANERLSNPPAPAEAAPAAPAAAEAKPPKAAKAAVVKGVKEKKVKEKKVKEKKAKGKKAKKK